MKTPINYNSSTPASRIRVCLLYRRENQQTVTGTPECITKFSPALCELIIDCAKEGGPLAHTAADIEAEIAAVIKRSTKAGNTNRTIINLCGNNSNWTVTITPIFPTSPANRG